MAATQSPNSQSPLNSTSSSIITTSASQSQTPPTTTNSSIITTSASQSQTPPTTTRSSTIEEPASKNQTPLALRVYSLPSSLFQSANNVKKAFHLEGKKEAGRGNRATEWTFRYRDGIKHTWKEQPMLTDNLKPITKVTKATRSSNPIKAPGPEGLNDFEWCHKYGANKWKSGFDQKAYYDNVFHIWKCNHCRNYDYGDDYATIPHLVDWEMKCALEGNWDGLSHMLTVPKKDNPAQQSGEMKPESMKPLKMWKWEWSLATRVFRQKQKHDEWKVKKMGGYVKAMGLREEWDEVAERRVEEVEKEDLEAASTMVTLASMAVESGVKKIESDTATLTASPTPTPAPTPKKRKRAAKEAESAPTAQSNGDELRRGKRARKATVPFNSLNYCYERHHPNLEAPAPIDEQEKLFVLVIKPSTPTSLTFSMPHNQQYFNTMLNSKPQFTDAQRSQQARGKPYASKSAGEPYEARAKREQAAQILESLELLVWHSNARNESVAQTRHHFQNVMLGLPDAEPVFREEYEKSTKGKDPRR